MCNKSETIGALAKALAGFNGEVSRISKDAANPFFKNNYATLDNIIDEVRPILTKHGLSIMQFPSGDGERVIIKTMIIHESGEWLESDPLAMKPVKNDPQAVGSAVTYGRRYSLAAFLSLNTGEDDDGNKATHDGAPKGKKIEPTASLKAKYQMGRGSMEGFTEWVKKMQDQGQTFEQMEEILTAALAKKKQEEKQ